MLLQKSWRSVRDSLWFMPTVWVLVCAFFAFALVALDRTTPDFAARYPLVFGGGAEGARGLLSSIAGSMITVAGVVFSITIVALQLASSQFSPRVLRNFMRDRPSQLVLGAFLGTFTYAILVLRSIRSAEEGGDAFVPALGVTGGIVLALVALGMLVFFIHHIATRIQVTTVVATIADDTSNRVEEEWSEDPVDQPDDHALPDGVPGIVRASDSGNLQLFDSDEMLELATELRLVVRLDVRSGEWVQAHAPLFSVWPASAVTEDVSHRLQDTVTVGDARSTEQDAAFGIRQLVDVAVKAISPGINDPTTATDAIDRLTHILVTAGRRFPPPGRLTDSEGDLRVLLPYRSFDDLVALAFDQLRQYGDGKPDVLLAIVGALGRIASAVPATRHAPLHRQGELLRATAGRLALRTDRDRVLRALAETHVE